MIDPHDVQDDTPDCRPRFAAAARVSGGMVFAAALTLGGAGLATADPGEDPSLQRTTLSSSEQDDAVDYWTTERMEAAAPAEDLVADAEASSTPVASTASPLEIPAAPMIEGNPQPVKKSAAAAAGTDHIGKVFFTLGGQDYVCSANSVASQNDSTVSTAAHCVNGDGSWATNWVFAPGYDQGDTPYGLWSATDIVAPTQWTNGEDISYDVAFAVVEPESGSATLSDTVGGSAVGFNQQRGQQYTAFGYPATAPFDGESLETCQGVGSDDTIGGSDSEGISCDMTGGSSGGPWFLGDGAQNSVNSFGYDIQSNVMYGPYFGAEAQSAYEEAAA